MRFSGQAIGYGCLAYFGTSLAVAIPFVSIAYVTNSDRTALETTIESAGYRLIGLILGLVAMAAGGYVAARKAPRDQLKNALSVGLLVTLLLILFEVPQVLIGIGPDRFDIISILLMPPTALAGGLLWIWQMEKSAKSD